MLPDQTMNIIKGRHPVVDAIQGGHFVCNDCNMNQHKMWIITGPNMGGVWYVCTYVCTYTYVDVCMCTVSVCMCTYVYACNMYICMCASH